MYLDSTRIYHPSKTEYIETQSGQKMRRAYKFRLYPNGDQCRELSNMLETHRRLYNACLWQRKAAFTDDGVRVTYGFQSGWFKNQRYINAWFARVNFSSAQATMRRLDRAFQAFFRRLRRGQTPGYPRFKANGRFDSVEFPAYGDGIKLLPGGKLRVQHVGRVKVKQHRAIVGTIKTVQLKHEAEHWYAIFSCDLGPVVVSPSTNPPVGIDLGLEHFLTTSDGTHEPNPRYLKFALPVLRRQARAVSRKQLGGKNRRKAVRKLRRIYAHVRNLRYDHRHKVALGLCRRYGLIAVERLNVTGMLRNRRVSRAIADAAWSGFLATLRDKAESAGVEVVEVDARGTSQVCSNCGQVVEKALSQRIHACECGCTLHRDVNAARNILGVALARTRPAGANSPIGAVA